MRHSGWEDVTRYIPDPKLPHCTPDSRATLDQPFPHWSPARANHRPGQPRAPVMARLRLRACPVRDRSQETHLDQLLLPLGRLGLACLSPHPAPPATFMPDLPSYLNDLASQVAANELQCRPKLTHGANEKAPYRNNFKLEGIDQPPANLKKYVQYQGRGYTLGSTTWSWIVNTCVVDASAWWNNSRNAWPRSARSGSASSTRTTSSAA